MNQPATTSPSLPAPYQIIRNLGSGSFGNVYLVNNTENNSRCVIKQLHPISNNPKFIKQAHRLFKKEAESLRKLNHPQIPRLIDYFEDQGEFYLVEEYIQGYTLADELLPDQPWREKNVVKLLYEGLLILKDIHAQGLIHRDIKPSNFIRREKDKRLVLIDFGAVKEFNVEQTHLINPTVAIGTHGYMPTEQAKGKPRKNSDLYALGIIAIQALTGKNPVELPEDDAGEIAWRNRVRINDELADILTKMIRYNHKQRYQSAEEVILALNDYLQSSQKRRSQNISSKAIQTPAKHSSSRTRKSSSAKASSSSSKGKKIEKSDSFGDWLKSPLGSTITTALTIGLVATGGIYYMNVRDTTRIEQEKQDFLVSLEKMYDNQAYTQCFELVQEKITDTSHVLTNKAKEYLGKCRLEDAKRKAQIGNYEEAMEVADAIPENDVYYNQAQIIIQDWSKTVFNQAKRLYQEEGDLEGATEKIDTIPDNKIRQVALINLKKWQDEYRKNTHIITQAERDLEYGNCADAMGTVSEVYGSNYWLLQGKKIVDKAKKCLEDKPQPTVIIPHQRDPRNRQNTRDTRDTRPPRNTRDTGGPLDLCDPPSNPLCPDN